MSLNNCIISFNLKKNLLLLRGSLELIQVFIHTHTLSYYITGLRFDCRDPLQRDQPNLCSCCFCRAEGPRASLSLYSRTVEAFAFTFTFTFFLLFFYFFAFLVFMRS